MHVYKKIGKLETTAKKAELNVHYCTYMYVYLYIIYIYVRTCIRMYLKSKATKNVKIKYKKISLLFIIHG